MPALAHPMVVHGPPSGAPPKTSLGLFAGGASSSNPAELSMAAGWVTGCAGASTGTMGSCCGPAPCPLGQGACCAASQMSPPAAAACGELAVSCWAGACPCPCPLGRLWDSSPTMSISIASLSSAALSCACCPGPAASSATGSGAAGRQLNAPMRPSAAAGAWGSASGGCLPSPARARRFQPFWSPNHIEHACAAWQTIPADQALVMLHIPPYRLT